MIGNRNKKQNVDDLSLDSFRSSMFSDCDKIIEDPEEEELGSDGTPDENLITKSIFSGAASENASSDSIRVPRANFK